MIQQNHPKKTNVHISMKTKRAEVIIQVHLVHYLATFKMLLDLDMFQYISFSMLFQVPIVFLQITKLHVSSTN